MDQERALERESDNRRTKRVASHWQRSWRREEKPFMKTQREVVLNL